MTGREADPDRALVELIVKSLGLPDDAFDDFVPVVDVLLANPDVVLRALPPDAVLTWLDNQDGYGFIVEAIRAGAAEPI